MKSLATHSLLFIGFTLIFTSQYTYGESRQLADTISKHCSVCIERTKQSTGSYILEYGEEALLSRASLARNAQQTIDIQYFIWSTDNIGILAGESLLAAAERGVRVRIIVDDLLIDAEDKTLLALDAHPNVYIKAYNPKHSVGTSRLKKIWNVVTDFRGVNQRMHDKTAIFDGVVGITGGRNMADEYFDYNQTYNFRDRDILLMGKAVSVMTENFEEFWDSDLSVSVSDLLRGEVASLSEQDIRAHYSMLHQYAASPDNFEPEVRKAIDDIELYFPELVKQLVWDEAVFISDAPGKNANRFLLDGGGESTTFLVDKLLQAETSVLIQSPYLVLQDETIALMARLVKKGVRIEISTNSLESTDNLMAFSGYQKQREDILRAGVEVYEYKAHPQIQQDLVKRYPRLKDKQPVFAIHAKSMVIDQEKVYIGTFNLDPRSANLNTEVGVYIENKQLGRQLYDSIRRDMKPGNSYYTTLDFNPDKKEAWRKRFKAYFYRLLPMTKLL